MQLFIHIKAFLFRNITMLLFIQVETFLFKMLECDNFYTHSCIFYLEICNQATFHAHLCFFI